MEGGNKPVSSTTIDERVLEMRFDSKQFESGVKTTMSTLDKLKSALKLPGSSKAMEDVAKAASKVDFSPIGRSADAVRVKISALQVAAVTAMGKITSSAMSAAKSMADQFSTVANMKAGFEEYELKMNSIQTIMSNTRDKGTTMAEVTATLDELNTYADKTIYNFAEMTRNIGTFTAAGVDLQTSTKAIQGIANLAAMSGSSSVQASTAMYQLSQALAAGRVQLMDWNSVVNAGMGGQLFQNALKETAREFEIDVDAMIEKHGSFRESLQEGWITAEVMTTTLNKMTVEGAKEYGQAMLESGRYTQEQVDALVASAKAAEDAATKVKTFTQLIDTLKEAMGSGWAKTWELIVGDFDQAKDFFTELSQLLGGEIDASADRRNNLIEEVMGGGGTDAWAEVQQKIADAGVSYEQFCDRCEEVGIAHGVLTEQILEDAGSFEASLKEGWLGSDIFSEAMESMVGSAADPEAVLAEYQRLVDEIWNGDWGDGETRFQALTDAGYDWMQVQALVDATVDGHRLALEELSDEQLASIGLTEEQIDVMRQLGDGMDDVNEQMTKKSGRELLMEGLLNIVQSLVDVFGAVRDAWHAVFNPADAEDIRGVIEGFHDLTEKLKPTEETVGKIAKAFGGLFSIFKIVGTVVKPFAEGLWNALFGGFNFDGGSFLDTLADTGQALFDFSNSFADSGIAEGWFSGICDSVVSAREAIWGFFGDIFESTGLASVTFDDVKARAEEFIGAIGKNFTFPGLEGLKDILGSIKDFFTNLIKPADDAGSSIGDALSGAKDTLSGFADGFEAPSLDGLTGWAEGAKSAVSSLGDALGKAAGTAADFVKGLFDGIGSAASGFGSGVGSIFSSIGSVLSGIVDALAKLDISGFGDLLAGGGILAIGTGIKNFLKAFDPLEGVKDATKGVAESLDGVKGALKSFQTDLKADALMKMAGAIAILTAAVWVMSTIDAERLDYAATAVVAMMGALALSTKIVASSSGDIVSAGKSLALMVGMAASVLILASACSKLAAIDTESLIKSGLAVSVLMGVMAGATRLVGSSKGGLSSAIKMIAMAETLKMVASVCEDLGSIDQDKLIKGGVAAGSLIAVMGVFNKLSEKSRGIGGALGVLALAESMKLILPVVQDFAEMDEGKLRQGMDAVSMLMAVVGGMMAVMGASSHNMLGVGIGFAAVAGSLSLLAGVVGVFSQLDLASLGAGLLGIVGTLGAVAVGIAAIGLASKLLVGAAPTLLAFGVAMGLLGAAVLAAGAGFSMFAAGLAAIVGIVTVSGTAITGFATMLGTAVASLVPLFAQKLGEAIAALCATIAECSPQIGEALLTIVGTAIDVLVGAADELATGLFEVIIVVMDKLIEYGPQILERCPGVIDFFIDFFVQVFTKLSERAGDLLGPITDFLAQVFEFIKPGLEALSPESLIQVLESVAIIVAIMNLLNLAKGAAVGAYVGIFLIGLAVAEVAAVLAALGALKQIEGIDWFISEGGELLKSIGNALGGFIGAVAGSAAEEFSGHMPEIGANLSDFMDNVSGFVEGAKSIDSSVLEGIGYLSGAITALVASELATAIMNILTLGSDFKDLATELVEFSDAIAPFVAAVSGYSAESFAGLTALTAAICQLAESAFITAVSDLLGAFTGTGGLADFGDQLSGFGEGLSAFVDEVDGVEVTDGVTNSIAVGQALSDLAHAIPSQGGLVQFIAGAKKIGEFGEDAADFGTGLKNYVDAVKDIEVTSGVNAAPAIGEALGKMAESVPSTDGLAQLITGAPDIGKFGEQAADFGAGLKNYVTAVDGLTENDGTKAAPKVGESLAELAKQIPEDGGFVQAIAGSQNIGSFGENAAAFGTGIKKFADEVSGIDSGSSESAVAVGTSLATLASTLDPSGSIFSFFTGEKSVATFGANIAEFGTSMKTFSDNVTGIDAGNMNGVVQATKTLSEAFKTMKEADVSADTGSSIETACGYVSSGYQKLTADANLWNTATVEKVVANVGKLKGMLDNLAGTDSSGASSFETAMESLSKVDAETLKANLGSADLGESLSGMFGSVGTVVSENTDAFSGAGKDLAGALADGFQGQYSSVREQISYTVKACLSAIEEKKADFKAKGTSSMGAFADGIKGAGGTILSAINSIASGCTAALSGLYSSFYSSGSYAAQGLANGMTDNTYMVAARASAMASAAKIAANEALKVNSPSKVFWETAMWCAVGMASGFDDNTGRVSRSASAMGTTAADGLREALSGVSEAFSADLDVQPVVRPVVDLSGVEHGARRANGILSGIDVSASVGKVSAMGGVYNARSQNGYLELASAVGKLERSLGSTGNTSYNINGITYERGTEAAELVEQLIRAVRVEGRV